MMPLQSLKSGSSHSPLPHPISSSSPTGPPLPDALPRPALASIISCPDHCSFQLVSSLPSSTHEGSFSLAETQLCADILRALTAERMKSELWLSFQACHHPSAPTHIPVFFPTSFY